MQILCGTIPLSWTISPPQTLNCGLVGSLSLVLPSLQLTEILLSTNSSQTACFLTFTFISHFPLLSLKSFSGHFDGNLEMGRLHHGVKPSRISGAPSFLGSPRAPPCAPSRLSADSSLSPSPALSQPQRTCSGSMVSVMSGLTLQTILISLPR